MSMVGTRASAYDAYIDGIYYNFSGTEATVTYYDRGYENGINKNRNAYKGDVVIPESISYSGNYYSVTSIGYAAFSSCTGLTSINIPTA